MTSERETESFFYWLIVLFIYLSIFINSFVFFKQPFEFYFGYLIYIILSPVLLRRYGISRQLLVIFAILFITGMFNIVLGNNTAALFFKVFVGLILSYLFYDGVIKEFKFDIEQLFSWYLLGAYIVCIVGLIQFVSFQVGFTPGYNYRWIFNKWGLVPGGNFGIRINSVFAEPTHLAGVISPAFFVAVYNLTRKQSYLMSKFRGLVIIVVFLLSFSALGQLGIFLTLSLLLLNFGMLRYVLLLVFAGIFLFNVLYNNVSDFRERYDGLVSLFTNGPKSFVLGKTHGSSFILYNNFHVTVENFKTNFAFGSGIGSHPVAFAKYNIAKGIQTAGFNNNSADANSMLLRLISETGLFGTLIFLFIIMKFYVPRNPSVDTSHWLISNSILVMILLNLFRQGHYFLNGFPFFVILYIYNSISYRMYLETGKTLYEHTVEDAQPSLEADTPTGVEGKGI